MHPGASMVLGLLWAGYSLYLMNKEEKESENET